MKNAIEKLQRDIEVLIKQAYIQGGDDALKNMSTAKKSNNKCGVPLISWSGKRLCSYNITKNGRCNRHQETN